jgi:DNA repair exonuclease SbcCD ATPase subunit
MKQILNKFFALFVLALFLVSVVPLALADDESGTNDVEDTDHTEEVDEDDSTQTEHETEIEEEHESEIEVESEYETDNIKEKMHIKLREKLKIRNDAIEHIKRTEIREHVQEVQQNALEHRKEVLERAKMHRENLHENLEQAREHYQEKKEELQEHKVDLKEKREHLLKCKEEGEDICENERHQIRKGVVDQGRQNIDFIIAAFEKMKHRLDDASDISDVDKETIVTMIDAKLADLESAKEQFSALGDDATSEEIKAAAQNLKDVWKEMKPTYKWAVGMVLSSKLSNTITDITDMDDRLIEKIENLESNGFDMSEARDLLTEFEDVVLEADSSVNEAQNLLSTLDVDATSQEIKDTVNKAHQLLQDARHSFDEAKGIIRKLFSLIKDAEHDLTPGEIQVDNEQTGVIA